MEPRIQYAKTADGVSIAFWTLREGMPLISTWVNAFCHIQMQWQIPEWRRSYERLAEKQMLVCYDCRGAGLSQHDVADYSLEAHVLDLEAVVDRLGLERFGLLAFTGGGPVAIAYPASHPERVSHLVLWCSWARGSDIWGSPTVEALDALREKNWDMYLQTTAHAALGWSESEQARRYAESMRQTLTPQAVDPLFRAYRGFDATGLLPQVESPTLVLHRRQVPYPDVEVATGLASLIPNARLAVLEGESSAPWVGDMESVASAIDEFLSEGEEAVPAEAPEAGAFRTILFTDMESSTALRRQLGDAKAQELVRTHNTIVRDALKTHGGSEIKHTGDGIMASFPIASGALECAVAIQRGVAAHVEQHPDAPLGVYIGLNAGEPISEEKDLFGTSVDLARRICDNAQPGQILVSDLVAGLAAGKGFVFEDQGEASLKGFDRPVRLYEVRWRE